MTGLVDVEGDNNFVFMPSGHVFVALIHENTFVCYCVRLVLISVIVSPGGRHTLAYQFCFPKLRNIE